MMGRDWRERWSPRPPDMRRRVRVRFEREAWRRGMTRWRVVRGLTGRVERRRSGAREMNARIWWGVV